MVENITLKDDEIALQLKDAQAKLNIAQLALQTVGFEASFDSEKLDIFLEDLTTAETELNTEIQNLNTAHKEILNKLKEKNNASKLADFELENFKKEKHAEFDKVKAEFETKVKLSQKEADNKYNLEEKQAKAVITSKEREKNSKLNDAIRLRDIEIKTATKNHENQLKQITLEFNRARNAIETTQKNKIEQAEKAYKEAQRNTANLVKLAENTKNELDKIKINLQSTPAGPKKDQLVEKQKTLSNDSVGYNKKISELREEEEKQKELYENTIKIAEEEAKTALNE